MKVVVFLMAVFLVGCSVTKEPPSAIVQKAQVLRSGRTFRNVGYGRAGLVQQT